jgi:EmrB/QacA subfamily drug resistance transporter
MAREQANNPDTGAEKGSIRSLPRRQVMITLAGVMLAMFLSSLDQTIVGTAMPKIIVSLGGFTQYTWVSTAYIITSTVAIPITGKLTDMYGRKWFYIAGIIIFVVGSILCGISQTMTQLIFSRGFQGVGAGIMMANAFTVIGDIFPPAERGRYQGLMTATFGVSAVVGPTIGGYITDHLSWHWVFFVNIPFGVLIIALFVLFFPPLRPDKLRHKIDYAGITTLILGVVTLLLAISWGDVEYPWDSVQIISMFAFSAVMIVVFVAVESRAKEPIIPLWIFRDRIVAVSIFIGFIIGFCMFGGIMFIPLFFQGVMGLSATSSGNFLTPMMLGIIVGSIVSGQMLVLAGGHYRLQGMAGLAIMALGLFLLSRMSVETSYATAVTDIVIAGVGIGITMPLYTLAVQNAVPYSVLGTATSATAFFRSIGSALGLAIFGSVMNNRFASDFIAGLPAQVTSIIPAGRLDALAHNPQALLSADAQATLRSLFEHLGPQGAAYFDQVFHTLRLALASAVTEVFLIALIFAAIAWVANLFLKEIPLRKRYV